MKNRLFYIFVLLLILNACDFNKDNTVNDSYIQGFVRVSALSISAKTGLIVDFDNKKVSLQFNDIRKERTYSITDGICLYIKSVQSRTEGFYPKWVTGSSSSDLNLKYQEYLDLIGDKGFDKKYRNYGVLCSPCLSVAIIDTLQSVAVTCDKDFTENLPAGSNLNELFTIFYDDPYAVVKNGYRNYTGEDAFRDDYMVQDFPYAFIGNKLSAVDFTKKPFIGDTWILYLNEAPDKTDTYTFSVKITKTDGTVLSARTYPIGIKGKE